jgi:MerR family mercuric resistance operon transcriptional regulator
MTENQAIYSIGQLATAAGCTVETIHFYEKKGLMPQVPRSPGGHRQYHRQHLKRLQFIRRCRQLGFSTRQITDLLKFIDEPGHFCGEVKAMAMQQARTVQDKIEELQSLQEALFSMANRCQGGAYSIDDCPIIASLRLPEN